MAYFAAGRPRIFGHRGAAGLAPENTHPSFAMAVTLGVGYLELDVHGTRDGAIVVMHDATLDRTTDGAGPVSACTLTELQQLDAGFRFTWDDRHFPYRGQGIRIPTLDSVLSAFPEHCFNIEIKQATPDIVDSVVRLIEQAGVVDRTLLAAENDAVMQRIRAAAGGRIVTGMGTQDVVAFMDRFARSDWDGYVPPGRALQIPPSYEGMDLVTRDTLAAAHRVGLEVHVWTINDRAEIVRLLDLGVDGIISDLPGLAVMAAARLAG